jgi:hypothetical protein
MCRLRTNVVCIRQFYYPESLYRMFIINAPFVFRAVWAMVKPWLHPITKERVRSSFLFAWPGHLGFSASLLIRSVFMFVFYFCSSQIQLVGDNYKEKLLDLIDADQLPKELGGACDCSNEATCPKTQQVCRIVFRFIYHVEHTLTASTRSPLHFAFNQSAQKAAIRARIEELKLARAARDAPAAAAAAVASAQAP